MTTEEETDTETEERSKNTPAITDDRHRKDNKMKIFEITTLISKQSL